MLRKVVSLTILASLLTVLGASASLGAAPTGIEFGDLEPGETVEQNIYLVTSYDSTFSINPSLSTGATVNRLSEGRENRHEISEAEIGDWFEFDESVEVDPNESETYELEDGSSVNANAFFTLRLNVPSDAEPGYHYGSIRLNPEIDDNIEGAGATTWGETRPNYVFRVSGQAERDIEITNINGVRVGDNQVQIIKQIQNTGTVTTRLRGGNITILNEENEEIDDLSVNSATLAPGEVAEIDSTWNSQNVQGGNYQVEGIGDYITGETYISGDFAITDVIRDPVDIDEPEAESEDDADIPYTLLLMVLLFLGVILYLLEIDLVWTIIFVGVTGISLFILFSSAPSYLILILAGLIGVTLYYGI